MKNMIYAIVIVLCIALAVLIFVKTQSGGSGGIGSIKSGEEMYWIKCNNPSCGAEYEIDKKDFFEQIKEKQLDNPALMVTPALTCKKCEKDSVYRAVKCEKCGTVSFYGARPDDLQDRCTKCGYSKMEAVRKARLAERGG